MQFRYHLQKLVDLKTNEKEQAEWALSEAIVAMEKEKQQLAELHNEQDRLSLQLESAAAGRTTISAMQVHAQYMQHLSVRQKQKVQEVDQAIANVTTKQLVLTDKMMEEKVWTKAKEKAREQFTAFVLKKEQEELDEIALGRRVHTIEVNM
ncbi:MAG: flagellar export protein FliJ [Paenibacillus sp.]|jgi:flagellar FliJ protein|nr:flagellar export protein FliJ [Paenibacillus sp.]